MEFGFNGKVQVKIFGFLEWNRSNWFTHRIRGQKKMISRMISITEIMLSRHRQKSEKDSWEKFMVFLPSNFSWPVASQVYSDFEFRAQFFQIMIFSNLHIIRANQSVSTKQSCNRPHCKFLDPFRPLCPNVQTATVSRKFPTALL